MSDENYLVGYKKPPVSSQFKKGSSGNPAGRPRGTKNLATDLREELSEKILTREGDKVRKMSKQRAALKALTNKALKGEIAAINSLLKLTERLIDDAETEANTAVPVLSQDDEAIIAQFLKSQSKKEG